MDSLAWLAQWYLSQCDGDWEHQYGVTIATLDNPGWSLKIDLLATPLETLPFSEVACGDLLENENPMARWHVCRVRESRFEGFGGPLDLEAIISVFREWAEHHAGQAAHK